MSRRIHDAWESLRRYWRMSWDWMRLRLTRASLVLLLGRFMRESIVAVMCVLLACTIVADSGALIVRDGWGASLRWEWLFRAPAIIVVVIAVRGAVAWFRRQEESPLGLDRIVRLSRRPAAAAMAIPIVATIIGDSTFQIVSGDAGDWAARTWIWRTFWFSCAIALVWTEWPDIARRAQQFLNRRNMGSQTIAVEGVDQVVPTSALIVIVSTRPDGAAQKAVDLFLGAGALRYAYLIHSPGENGSRGHATKLKQVIDRSAKATERTIEVFDSPAYSADFLSIKSMFDVCKYAITEAVKRAGSPHNVVIEITGGTKIATAGALLAQTGEDIVVSYIPEMGNAMMRVDVKSAAAGPTAEPDANES